MNIRIRLMEDVDIQNVNEVYNNTYGNIRPLKNFEWEFLNGPWGRAIYILAEDLEKSGNKIIGTQSAIPIQFINGKGTRILTAKSEDTFVHPDYRGHKLFDKMYDLLFAECKKNKIEYIWGFTYARKPFLKIGFQIPFETQQGVFVNKPIHAFNYLSGLNPSNTLKDKLKIFLLCTYSKFLTLACGAFRFKSTIDVNGYTENKQYLILSILNENQLWSIDQSPTYQHWRLRDNPYSNSFEQYSISDEHGNCEGSFIANKRPEGFVYLEEFLSSKNVPVKRKVDFLRKAIHLLKTRNSFSMLRFWGFPTNPANVDEMNMLKRIGFTFVNKGTAFVWKDLENHSDILITPENIHLSRLYTQGNR